MTTLPTAIIPSRLERFDSKYIARAMQSTSLLEAVFGGVGLPQLAKTMMLLRATAVIPVACMCGNLAALSIMNGCWVC